LNWLRFNVFVLILLSLQILLLLSETALDFATPQIDDIPLDTVMAVQVSEFQENTELNGVYRRAHGLMSGKHPVFRKGNLLFYFRPMETRWVIDHVFRFLTRAICKAPTGGNITGRWEIAPDWVDHPEVSVTMVLNSQDPTLPNSVYITGLRRCAYNDSALATDNGEYFRQPDFQDVNRQPLYQHSASGRYLFFNPLEKRWQLSIGCAPESAAFAQSCSENLVGSWQTLPPSSKTFDNPSVRWITYGEQLQRLGLAVPETASPAASATGGGEVAAANPDATAGDDLLDMALITSRIALWNDRNHEALLFTATNTSFYFVASDIYTMRSHIHPGLLQLMQNNNISVGMNADQLHHAYEAILANITGVKVPVRQEGFCLTADGLLKLLAIYYRLRSNIPVILMGENGCGKTWAITFLCKFLGIELRILTLDGGKTEKDVCFLVLALSQKYSPFMIFL
jgi:hypothetical protein